MCDYFGRIATIISTKVKKNITLQQIVDCFELRDSYKYIYFFVWTVKLIILSHGILNYKIEEIDTSPLQLSSTNTQADILAGSIPCLTIDLLYNVASLFFPLFDKNTNLGTEI